MFALLLALHSRERHGYALLGDVERLTGGTLTLGPATLYRSLQRMRVEELVEEIPPDGTEPADRRAERRRRYRITPAGRAAVRVEARRLSRLVDAAAGLGLLAAGDEEGVDRDGSVGRVARAHATDRR